jgi:hypothetical protein
MQNTCTSACVILCTHKQKIVMIDASIFEHYDWKGSEYCWDWNTNFIQQLPQSHHYHILHHDSHLLHHEHQHQQEEQPFLVPCIHHDLTAHVLLSLHNSCSDVLLMGWLLHNLESSSNSCIGHAHNS